MALLDRYIQTTFRTYADMMKNFRISIPDNFNFAYDVVDEIAKRQPDKLAMLWVSNTGEERRFTFGDIKRLSDKTANMLSAQGIKKGDKVMLVLKRRYQFWYTIIALHKLGAVAIPATNLLTQKDYIYRNNSAGVNAIICVNEPDVINHVNSARAESPTVRLYFAACGDAPEGYLDFDQLVEETSADFVRPTGSAATRNEDMMLLYFTSGTTGYPKMVYHDFLYPLGHIITAWFWHCVTPDGLHLTLSDTGWAKSMWGKLYGQWLSEAAILTYDFDKFQAADILAKMEKYRITTFCAPPTMYRYLIKEPLEKYDLSSLVHVTTAGEALNPEVYSQFKVKVGLEIHEGFGQTEATLMLATFPFISLKPGSMGKSSPGYDLHVLRPDGTECNIGEEGELCIATKDGKPVGMFSGYYKDNEMTSSVWYDDMYHTCDVVWRDGEGYFWYVGRTDDVIKSSGYRIGPFEVESALLENPAVLEAAVTGVPDADRGMVVKATIVLAPGYSPSEELKKELQEHVKKVTAPYKYPRIIEFTDALPKTISGKIRRVELREKDSKPNNIHE